MEESTFAFIERHEGRRDKVYLCPAGKRTIGVGFCLDYHPLPRDIQKYLDDHGHILDEHIDRLLTLSISWAVSDCNAMFPAWKSFSHNRKKALTDWLFQLGKMKASSFVHAIAAINTGRWDDAADHMLKSRWAEQTPVRAKEVTDLIRNG